MIRKDRWLQSKKKWQAIRRKLKAEIPFTNSFGWFRLWVHGPCGFCEEAKENSATQQGVDICNFCSLHKVRLCGNNNEEHDYIDFLRIMRGGNPDFKAADRLALKILKHINKSETYEVKK